MAREAGRVAATGEIIAQLDADCIAPKDWISRAIPKFKPGIIAVAGSYFYHDGPFLMRWALFAPFSLVRPVNFLIQKFKFRAAFVGGNIFIRADVLQKAGGYSKVTTFYGDEVDTANRIIPFGKIRFMPSLVVNTSARRYKAFGFLKTQKKYDKSSWSILGKTIFKAEEKNHPR